MQRLIIPLVLSFVLAGSAAQAAPPSSGMDAFGIAMGTPVRKVEGAKAFKPGWFQVAAPPRPDSRFPKVAVQAFAGTGVCVVQGVGAEISGDPTGTKIRSAIDRLADDFSVQYGQPERLDTCTAFACAADLWGEDLQTGERRYGYRWALHDGPAKGVREVSVVAVAHSVSSFVYVVQFDSAALTPCRFEQLQVGD